MGSRSRIKPGTCFAGVSGMCWLRDMIASRSDPGRGLVGFEFSDRGRASGAVEIWHRKRGTVPDDAHSFHRAWMLRLGLGRKCGGEARAGSGRFGGRRDHVLDRDAACRRYAEIEHRVGSVTDDLGNQPGAQPDKLDQQDRPVPDDHTISITQEPVADHEREYTPGRAGGG